MARRIPRLATLGGILAFGLLALGNGLDRAAALNPGLARFVPEFLSAEAARSQSAQALQNGDTKPAIAEAERAVRADPVDPRSTALLGAGQLAARQSVRADAAFRIAARFGWRDPLTQLYFMNAALAAGQPRLAAMRLDAILRQAPDFPVRDMLLAQFEASPAGRAALAERLASRPPWTFAFLNHASEVQLPSLRARAEIVAAMRPRWGCDRVAPLVTALVLRSGVAEASSLWQAQCRNGAVGIDDPRFARLPQSRQPVAFEWNLIGSGDVSAQPAAQAAPGATGLVARVSGPGARPVAWQMLVLPPGRYRLSWKAASPAGKPATGTAFSLGCALGERTPLPRSAAVSSAQRAAADLTIDGRCPGYFLTLWLEPGLEDTLIDDLALTAL